MVSGKERRTCVQVVGDGETDFAEAAALAEEVESPLVLGVSRELRDPAIYRGCCLVVAHRRVNADPASAGYACVSVDAGEWSCASWWASRASGASASLGSSNR